MSWTTPAGSGNVSKIGTPANNQIGVWTGDGTLEGTTGLTYDGSNFLLTGDIGATGTRITKGWFTDLQVTNAITGSVTGSAGTVAGLTITPGATISGSNTGDQTSIAGITGTKAQFDTAVTDGNFLYVGDAPTAHTSSHAVGGVDALFPADPAADKYLKWNNTSNLIEWADVAGGGSQTPWTSNINAAGYTLFGNSTASGNLTLDSTSDATKGSVLLNPTGGNVGIGTSASNKKLEINLGTTDALRLTYNDADGGATTYMDTTLSSTGLTTFTGAGSAPEFKFANDLTPVGRLVVPMGELSYFNTTGIAVAVATQSDGSTNMVKISPTTALSMGQYEFDNGGANNGRLRYTGATTKMFHTAITMSIAPNSANDTFVVGLAKNGTVVPSSRVLQKVTTSGDTQAFAFHLMVELATNDYLEVYIGNTSDADDLVVKTLNLFAVGM